MREVNTKNTSKNNLQKKEEILTKPRKIINLLFDEELRKKHKDVEETSVLRSRYKDGNIELFDHFHHLTNLYELYVLLEKLVSDKEFPYTLPRELCFLLERSKAIEIDINFLYQQPQIKEILQYHKVGLLPTTKKYIDSIKKMDKENVFIHFLMRILGDLYGGKFMGNYTMKLYKRKNLYTKCSSEGLDLPGLKFYFLPAGTLRKLLKFIRPIIISEDVVLQEAAYSYDAHFDILNEMEKTRSQYVGSWHFITKFSTIFMGFVWNSDAGPQLSNDNSDTNQSNEYEKDTGDSSLVSPCVNPSI